MSRDFAGVLTGKATNFVGGLPLSFLERPHDVRVDLLPYGNASVTIGCRQWRESGASPQPTALPQRCPPASAAATTLSAGERRPQQRCHNDVRRTAPRRTALPQRCSEPARRGPPVAGRPPAILLA